MLGLNSVPANRWLLGRIVSFFASQSMSYDGRVENGLVVTNQPLPLPNGTPVRVEPIWPTTTRFLAAGFARRASPNAGSIRAGVG